MAGIFGALAPAYDRFNRIASLGMDGFWRRRTVGGLAEGENVLDVGCGTGDLTLAAARRIGPRGRVTGLDFSEQMLDLARQKARAAGAGNVGFVHGAADGLPFDGAVFDSVISAFTLRSLAAIRTQCAGEIKRVMRPGGRAFLLELTRPSWPPLRGLHFAYLRFLVPIIGRIAAGSRWPRGYLESTVLAFPIPENYAEWFISAGMELTRIERFCLGAASLLQLRKPEKANNQAGRGKEGT